MLTSYKTVLLLLFLSAHTLYFEAIYLMNCTLATCRHWSSVWSFRRLHETPVGKWNPDSCVQAKLGISSNQSMEQSPVTALSTRPSTYTCVKPAFPKRDVNPTLQCRNLSETAKQRKQNVLQRSRASITLTSSPKKLCARCSDSALHDWTKTCAISITWPDRDLFMIYQLPTRDLPIT